MNETITRSIVKSIVWRVVGIFILGGIAYLNTKSWSQTTFITLVFHTIRTVLYVFHERLWLKINWGKIER